MNNNGFILKACLSPIYENDYKQKFGADEYNNLKLKRPTNCCDGCGATFSSQNSLNPHIIGEDLDNCTFVILCKTCHFTQHLDYCVENDIINFVNSKYSQAELIRQMRKGGSRENLNLEIKNRNIIVLDIDKKEYISKIRENEINNRDTIKVIFNDNFSWDSFNNFVQNQPANQNS